MLGFLIDQNQKTTKYIVVVKIIKAIDRDPVEVEFDHAMEILEVEKAAWSSSFYMRRPKKITASCLIKGFWKMQKAGMNTFRNWALFCGKERGQEVSKQAIDNRMSEETLDMAKQILKTALNVRLDKKWLSTKKRELGCLLKFFNRVIIQDSTTQQVADQLHELVGGNKTRGGMRALLRIQTIFNFTEEKWEDFSIDKYSQNDQSQAAFALRSLQDRDLLLRDLGYFVMETLEQLIENHYVITPYKSNINLYDEQANEIDLLELLRQNETTDKVVLVSKKKMLPMRLVAKKLSKAQKEKKIKQAKQKAHSNNNYTETYYELLGYEIYLTNVDTTFMSVEQIGKLYGLRWYIEVLFKAWKSYFNFNTIFEKNKMSFQRTLISMYLVLIQFVYLTNYVYQYFKVKVEQQGRLISMQKFMDVCKCLLNEILAISHVEQLDVLARQFARHAVYEKRNKRNNMKQKYQYFNELSP